MEEIQVGEYVRTDKGNIGKIIEIRLGKNEETNTYQNIYILDNGLFTVIDYIVKHSFNLIDLIEVGDYVNLERILDITGEYIRTTERIHNRDWLSKNIRSIVTHEQFASLEYKVEEKI